MAKRKGGIKTEKRKAWEAFSLYVRTKECIASTGSPEYGRCITCGTVLPIARLQAGHFIAGRTNGILYDERGVHLQCVACNHHRQGASEDYYPWMVEHYGMPVIHDLMRLRTKSVKFNASDHAEVCRNYQNKLRELLLERSAL